mgnify:CR=1 FL=1
MPPLPNPDRPYPVRFRRFDRSLHRPACDDLADAVEEARMMLVEAAAEGEDQLMEKYFEEETLSDDEILEFIDEELRENGVPASGGAIDGAGPTIANGMLYLNSGYPNGGGMPGNALIALSVDGQ